MADPDKDERPDWIERVAEVLRNPPDRYLWYASEVHRRVVAPAVREAELAMARELAMVLEGRAPNDQGAPSWRALLAQVAELATAVEPGATPPCPPPASDPDAVALGLTNVHHPDRCAGRPCCVHNPSDHHMREWRTNWRADRGLMERICPAHGIGHPDPDHMTFVRETRSEEDAWAEGVHGCCGCCRTPVNTDEEEGTDG